MFSHPLINPDSMCVHEQIEVNFLHEKAENIALFYKTGLALAALDKFV